MSTSKKVTIFEGPDGAGKTTAAREFARATNARYVHLSSLPHVTRNLARMYVEAMLPALLGYQDVVLDRCWLSEMPYGTAYRSGADRLGNASRRMLERLAMRCGAVVVRCQPPWRVVERNFLSRCGEEYLDTTAQLRVVYDLYSTMPTALPVLLYDYGTPTDLSPAAVDAHRMWPHPLRVASAGNWEAGIVLVGESFAERKEQDPLYQWPFASFSQAGCSQWLAAQLAHNGVPESSLLWLNADQDLAVLRDLRPKLVLALGGVADAELRRAGVPCELVPHPQHHKRFHSGEPYRLFDLI